MKSKIDMAHEMIIAMQSREPITDMALLKKLGWRYADLMHDEADKRKVSGVPDVLKMNGCSIPKTNEVLIAKDLAELAESIAERERVTFRENKPESTLKFDAEKWLYERKSAYPMVDCIEGSADGMWESFNYHPEYKGKVLHNGDIID